MISFVVRCRDEEMVLGRCLSRLREVNVPKQVVVILDRCTDSSELIASDFEMRDKTFEVHENHTPWSRAGLETLCTPAGSPYSLPTHINWCFSHARYKWKFHVGADFLLSEQLVQLINSGLLEYLDRMGPAKLRIPCVTPEDGLNNREPYLSNCLERFDKHVFWETPVFAAGAREIDLDQTIEHLSTLGRIKPYWSDPPWFADASAPTGDHTSLGRAWDAFDISRRWAAARAIVGEEPKGAARGSNPACDPFLARCFEKRAELEAHGIRFFE